MSVHIRHASVEDLDALVPLFDAYRQFYGQAPDPALAREFLRERFCHHQSVILLASMPTGEAIGFTQLFPSFSSVRAGRAYILNDLFVTQRARRQGAAAALLRKAADVARRHGALRLSLSTARSNDAAQRLYAALGWERDEVFLHYSLTL